MHLFYHMNCCPYPIYEFCHPIHSCYDPCFHHEEMTYPEYQGYQRYPEYQREPEYQRYQREPEYQGYPERPVYQRAPGEVNYQQSQIYNSHINGRG